MHIVLSMYVDLCMMCSMMSLVTHVKLLCLIQVQLDRGSHGEYMHEAVSSEQLTYLLLLAFSVGFSIASDVTAARSFDESGDNYRFGGF